MKLQKMIKNKKVKTIIALGMTGYVIFGTVKFNETKAEAEYYKERYESVAKEVYIKDYYDVNNIDISELNTKSRVNYEKLTEMLSVLQEEYGNPDKTLDILEWATFYTNENLDIKKARFEILPCSLYEYASIERKLNKDLGEILSYMKNVVEANIEDLNSFMNKENLNHIEVKYDYVIADNLGKYNLRSSFDYLKINEDNFVKFTNHKTSNSSEYTYSYFKIDKDELVEVSEPKIISEIEKTIDSSVELEDDFGIKITLDTRKEGEFERIGDSNFGYSKEEDLSKIDFDIDLDIIVSEEIFDRFRNEDSILSNEDDLSFIKNIETVINDNFEFITTKNLLDLKLDKGQTASYIAIKTDTKGNKIYSHISYINHLIEKLYDGENELVSCK